MGRAYTRFQKLRAVRRAKRHLKAWGLPLSKKNIHLFEKNRSPCSCAGCQPDKYRNSPRVKKVEEE